MRGARLYGAYRPASPKLVCAMPDISANSLVQVPPPHTCTTSGPCARVRPSAWNIFFLHRARLQIVSCAGSNVLSSSTATMSGCVCGTVTFLFLPQALTDAHGGGLSASGSVQDNCTVAASGCGGGIWIWVW